MIRSHARWDRLGFRAMRRLQLERLRSFLSELVFPFSDHYRILWRDQELDPRRLSSVSDLARYPLTTKRELAENPRDFILKPTPETIRAYLPKSTIARLLAKRLFLGKGALEAGLRREFAPTSVFFTTGRSASSTPVFLSPLDEQILRIAGGRIVDVLDLVPSLDRGLSLFPFAPHLAFWQVVACGRARNILTLHSGGGKAMGSEAILRLLKKMKPTFLVGIPGFTTYLLRLAQEDGIDLSRVRVVGTGGDVLTPAVRQRLQELVPQAQIVSIYGFTEARSCWTECAPGTGFHTYPDLGLFEVVNPETGELLPAETTGELVYTGLDGRGSALVRYRTGDIARGGISYAPCPECGRTIPRVGSVLTRTADGFANIKGTLVDLTVLANAVAADPAIEEWQAEISEEGELELIVAMPAEQSDALCRRVRGATEVSPDRITIVPREMLVERLGLETQMKETRVVDRRGKTVKESS